VAVYDENVLQQYADTLYRQAQSTVFWTILRYGFTTFLLALVAAVAVDWFGHVGSDSEPMLYGWALIPATLVGGIAGAAVGRRKAFQLKLLAQQALCQRQIEMNTRPRAS